MSPWHADPGGSLEFKNDRCLSQANIDTIAAWADGGAPEGNHADLTTLHPIPVGWQIQDLGEPDAVIRMPVAEVIPASGELPMANYYIPVHGMSASVHARSSPNRATARSPITPWPTSAPGCRPEHV